MYQAFYRLQADPFRLSPDHAFCYRYPSFSKGRAYMQYALNAAEGFVVVTGRPGMGKTTLINDLLADFGHDEYLVATLVNTVLEANDLLRTVAYEFGLNIEGVDKATVLQRLKQLFVRSRRAGRPPLLVVDEAQNLSLQALEELRLLTNLQLNGKPLLQIFLVGQEDLRDKLADPRLEQLRQRITAAAHLEPLNEAQTAAYIVHRLKVVGWEDFPKIKSSVLPIIHATCEGIPRRINQFCSRLLLHGSVEEKDVLQAEDARVVVAELGDERLISASPRQPAAVDNELGASAVGDAPQSGEVSILDTAEPLLRQQRVIRRQAPALAAVPVQPAPPPNVTPFPRPEVPTRVAAEPASRPPRATHIPAPTGPVAPESNDLGVAPRSRANLIPVLLIALLLGAALFAVSRFGDRGLLGGGSVATPIARNDTGTSQRVATAADEQPSAQAALSPSPSEAVVEVPAAAGLPSTPVASALDPSADPGLPAPLTAAANGVPPRLEVESISGLPMPPQAVVTERPVTSGADQLEDEMRPFDLGTVPPVVADALPVETVAVASPVVTLPPVETIEPPSTPLPDSIAKAERIRFGFDSAEIRAEDRTRLDGLAARLQGDAGGAVRIVGHADSIGPRAYNELLARRRAEAVADYLAVLGIPRERLYIDQRTAPAVPAEEGANTAAARRLVEVFLETP